MDAISDSAKRDVVPWAERDRDLEAKVRKLYATHLRPWLTSQSDRNFEQKWHVGRAMLDWLYAERFIDADEFEALNVKYSRPSKRGYDIEMYRIVFIRSGRASDEVAAVSLAPHMGPRKRDATSTAGCEALVTRSDRRPTHSDAGLGRPHHTLKAERELVYGQGGWIYAYAYEEDLQHCELLGREPRVKVGYTSGDYVQRVNTQARGTEVPDVPRILRAYQVVNPSFIEAEIHRRLKAAGRHHRRAGGSEWFRLTVEVLDGVVLEVVQSTPSVPPSR